MQDKNTDLEPALLAETDHLSVWKLDDPEEGPSYHVELSLVTLNFEADEWSEFVDLMRQVVR